MCGICGFVGFKNDELLRRMTDVLQHRGPDGEGYYISPQSTVHSPQVAMGMRRLAVIDLKTGNQPIFNEDRSIVVVFNGEIYNFQELRKDLESRGHKFYTKSDTEVIVHMYEEYGLDCPKYLRGMFAFALWDEKEKKLILARDHFGIKPLFYCQKNGKLIFASEIKSILLSNLPSDEIDFQALDYYFSLLYIPTPLTIYKDIKKLPPASILVFYEGNLKLLNYWKIPEFHNSTISQFQKSGKLSEEDCVENLKQLLRSSIDEQKISDVPLGVFLSGGLDSSTIVAILSESLSEPLRTFTIGYGKKDITYDETLKARLIAEKFRCQHNEYILKPDIAEIISNLIKSFDEPFADSSAIPTYLISQKAKEKITVALTGIGGDEIFAGYPRYLGARLSYYYDLIPMPVKKSLYELLKHLPESTSSRNIPGWIKRFSKGGTLNFSDRYISWITFLSSFEKEMLYTDDFRKSINLLSLSTVFGSLKNLDDLFVSEFKTYLTDDLLCLADRSSMIHSLEVRVPFLDVRLVEFASQIPLSVKTKNFQLKYLLKKMMKHKLPAEILKQKKMGFQVPLGRWINEEISQLIDELLNESNLKNTGILNPQRVTQMLQLHRQGKVNFTDQIYAMVIFELWCRSQKAFSARQKSKLVPEIKSKFIPQTAVVFSDIIPQDSEGGSGRVAWELAKSLSRLGDRIIIITKGQYRSKQDSDEIIDGIEIKRYHSNLFKYLKIYRNIFNRNKVDYVIFNHPFSSFIAALMMKKIPAVYSFNSPWHEEFEIRAKDLQIGILKKFIGSFLRKKTEYFVLRRSCVILTASRFMSEKLKQYHGLNSITLPLGVDTEKFSPASDRMSIRRSLEIPENKFLLLTVRNLVSRMGLENLVSAMKIVIQNEPDVFLIIGGRGYLKNKLESQIDELGLQNYVRMEGFIDDKILPDYYRAADLFVLPTRLLEGFGLVTLEAMSCGTPVLATPVGGNIEVVGKFNKEMLCTGCSYEDIAYGIIKFLQKYRNKSEYESLRKQCRDYVIKYYSWDNLARGIKQRIL